MRDESNHAPAGPLERPRRVRPRFGRRVVWLELLVFAGILSLVLVDRPNRPDCAAAVKNDPPGLAVIVCQREYQTTHVPATGVRLADALRQSDNLVAAKALATELLETPVRADALQILGRIASTEGRLDDAIAALETAQKLHRVQGTPADRARDLQALGAVLQKQHRFAEALQAFDKCIMEARASDDKTVEYYCHLSAGQVLSLVGYFELAQQELDTAAPLTASNRDLARLAYQRGNLDQELDYDRQAIVEFERTLTLNERAPVPGLALSTKLNLVYSLAEVGRTDDAARYLADAQALDLKHQYEAERTELAARIAFRRGNLALASSLNEQAFPMIDDDDDDDRIAVATMQTRIALASDDLVRAEVWAKRGVEYAERLRAMQSAVELRSWVLSTRREPYELLFVTLARAHRIHDAVMVFDQWQGRTMLDAMARPSPRASLDLDGVADRVQKLGGWLPIVSNAPLAGPPDQDRVFETLHTTDLLALVVADHDVWCLTANHGQLTLANLGPLSTLQDRFDRFVSAPTDRALASELGELILRDGVFRPTHDALHVLLDGPLGLLPVVALRRQDHPLIEVRPVVRVPRLPETSCVAARRPAHATIIADSKDDLPEARSEAQTISERFNTTSAVGAAATSQALFAAANDAVLHVAVHAQLDAGGGALMLHDQDVSALEISARKLGPSLVVLPACGSAQSKDAELAGSLATGFLAAGSTQVVATLRRVSDKGARELSARFYGADGANDPVRALAKVQAELADTDNEDWPNFAVFGHDICTRPL